MNKVASHYIKAELKSVPQPKVTVKGWSIINSIKITEKYVLVYHTHPFDHI